MDWERRCDRCLVQVDDGVPVMMVTSGYILNPALTQGRRFELLVTTGLCPTCATALGIEMDEVEMAPDPGDMGAETLRYLASVLGPQGFYEMLGEPYEQAENLTAKMAQRKGQR
jgi:hypothetical protein